MSNGSVFKRSLTRMAFLAALSAASACDGLGVASGGEYGGKATPVRLSTREQEDARAREASSAAGESLPSGATAYLLDLDRWIGLHGREQIAEIERHRLEGDAGAQAEATKKLLIDLAPYKLSTPTPIEVQVPARVHIFAAAKAGQVRTAEFDPVRMAPTGRLVVVSFEPVE